MQPSPPVTENSQAINAVGQDHGTSRAYPHDHGIQEERQEIAATITLRRFADPARYLQPCSPRLDEGAYITRGLPFDGGVAM